MKLAGKTDVGRVRQENQDDYRAGELPGGAVWALVCDGMGGARGGREASQGACNVIEQVFQEQYAQCGAGQEGAFLKKALISANRYVFNKAAHEESLAGMGTTAVCALVRGGEATLCHAGDSRAYLCRGGSEEFCNNSYSTRTYRCRTKTGLFILRLYHVSASFARIQSVSLLACIFQISAYILTVFHGSSA